MANLFKTAVIRPLTGPLDLRTPIDLAPSAAFRWKQNLWINGDGKLSRARGFRKPRESAECAYLNYDFHTQPDQQNREPITMLYSVTANTGDRRLFLGTKTRLAVLYEPQSEWTVFPSTFADDGSVVQTQIRFNAADLNNTVVFTNNYNLIQYTVIGTGTVQAVPNMAQAGEDPVGNLVPLTLCRRVVSWRGFMFLFNTVEGGVRYASRIRWSDLNNPISFKPPTEAELIADPSNASLAGYQDLDYGETIINAMPLAGALYVFTDKSIWRCVQAINQTVGVMTLECTRIYNEPRNQYRCLSYPNTLVSDGFSFYYLGKDNLYTYNPYLSAPETPDWIGLSTPLIYDDTAHRLDRTSCESPVMEIAYLSTDQDHPSSGELHISWPTYKPIAEQEASLNCEEFQLGITIPGFGVNDQTLVANLNAKTCDYRDYGMTSLVNFRSGSMGEAPCSQSMLFLGASGRDFCIKEQNIGFYREFYNPTGDTFTKEGYFSILRGVLPFDNLDAEKAIRSFLAEIYPDDPSDPATVALRIGTAFLALDVNADNGNCGIIWHTLSKQGIGCRFKMSPTQYAGKNLRPVGGSDVSWAFFYRGKFLCYELTIADADGLAPMNGGCSISRLEVSGRLV